MVVAGGYFLWSIYSYMSIKEPGAKTPPSKEVSGPALSGSSIPTNTTANVSIPQETNRRETEHSSVISKEKAEVVPPTPSNLLPSDAVIEETLEIGKIKGLLENIRQANLQKNIDLFISCYATDFKDREGKKKATLAYWKKFDYLDLSYNLKNPSISSDTAKARVEWLIKISPKTGSQPQESKTILDVTLKKEEGGWKIKEVKQAG
jgi:ketosteroid isomerase-like protein